jgi:[ribosomal protein S5]-alanine N-acetyltransferase
VIFATARLIVRPWADEDAADAFAIYRDPAVTRYLGGGGPHPDLAFSRRWIDLLAARNKADPPGQGTWAATLRETGRPIGSVLLRPLEGGPEVEVGYHLGQPWWGRSYATELARGCLRYGFAELGLRRIVGVTFPENLASQRVLRKAGLRHEGRGHHFGFDLERFVIDAPAGGDRPSRD